MFIIYILHNHFLYMVFVLVLINATSWNWTILLLWRDWGLSQVVYQIHTNTLKKNK